MKDVRETSVYPVSSIAAAVEPAIQETSSIRLTGKPSRR